MLNYSDNYRIYRKNARPNRFSKEAKMKINKFWAENKTINTFVSIT